MTLTNEQKAEAIVALRLAIDKRKIEVFNYWLTLFDSSEQQRKYAGFSKGADDMLEELVKAWRKDERTIMEPFDRGDYDFTKEKEA